MKADISILRKYKRASKSPFESDDSTILFLANWQVIEDKLEVNYSRYIYLHRDPLGKWLGISISQSLMDEKNKTSQYLKGNESLTFLLEYFEDIRQFLRFFSDEIEAVFGIDSETFLYASKARWRKKLRL